MKEESGSTKMRAIVEECLEMVREYKGSHSGEHGDGISRSEFHEPMFGRRMVENFEEVKKAFDPGNLFNPGKIVNPHKMDDRSIMRFAPGYEPIKLNTSLDWSEWNGFNRAVEMCNNNGACRKANVGTMCPSYRITKEERHLTRGRANTLRLAITGQLGADAFTSEKMYETMDFCVSCKGCKRECPTGVDMARMKIEFLQKYHQRHGVGLREKLFAYLPRYAGMFKRLYFLPNLRDQIPGFAKISEWLLGLSSQRPLPKWRRDHFRRIVDGEYELDCSKDVVLLVDTFNGCFESENAYAALDVLKAAGYRVHLPQAKDDGRALCCGRTFLSNGLVNEAKLEAERMMKALRPFVQEGVPIVGLEPSCLLTLRDEYLVLFPGQESEQLAQNSFMLEEFLSNQLDAGKLNLKLRALETKRALLHGHCHQKAFAVLSPVQRILALIPDLDVETIDSSCCGMAGSFGYEKEHYAASMSMGSLSLFPAIKNEGPDALIIADGTSCRGQIEHGTGRTPLHVARVLQMALADRES